MKSYPRPLHKSTRIRHFAAGAVASFMLFAFLVGVIGCDRTGNGVNADRPGVDVEVDVRPAPCDSTAYQEPPVTERREVDPTGNVRVRVTVRTCCCCCGEPHAARTGYVPPYPITGTGPYQPGPRRPAAPAAGSPPAATPIAGLPPLRSVPPATGGFPGGVPPDAPLDVPAPLPPVTTAGTPWWLSFIAAPLALLSLDGGDEWPEGVLCGDDSGLPTGPMRPRCN